MSFADDATWEIRRRAQEAAAAPTVSAGFGSRFGFTAPTVIYEKMRALDASASALDADWSANVAQGNPSKAAWQIWLRSWRRFFDKHIGEGGIWARPAQKLANIFISDDVRAAVDSYAVELDGWHQTYKRESGRFHSTPGAPPPMPREIPGEEKDTGLGAVFRAIPWWIYVLGAGMTAAIGYSLFRAGQHTLRMQEKLVEGAPQIASALAGRDASPIHIHAYPPPSPPSPSPPSP